jgi:chitin biosynthesis protein CHS5
VVLEWNPIRLATADLISLALYRNGQKAGNIPRPLQMHSTKISGLAVDTEYTFHMVLRTTAGTFSSERVAVRTHKMTDLGGITITVGVLPPAMRERLVQTVDRIGAKIVDNVRIDTTHFITTEGRGMAWEKAVEGNIPVVRPEWVEACEQSGRILGVTKFYLDAMRPVPMEQSQRQPSPPPPPPPDKDVPDSPATQGRPTDGSAPLSTQDGHPEPEEHSDESDDEAEPKTATRSPGYEEQKVRLEDKEEQKVAIRPGPSAPRRPSQGEMDGGEGSDTEEDGAPAARKKPGASPDASSFQEVEL